MYVSTRSAVLALTLAAGVSSALSQPFASPSSTVQAASRPLPAASTASGYRSSFEGYRAYSDQPLQSWRESNDTVGRIGDARADAGEGQGGFMAPQEMKGLEHMKGMKGMKGMANMPGMTGTSGINPGSARAPVKAPTRQPFPAAVPASAPMPDHAEGHHPP